MDNMFLKNRDIPVDLKEKLNTIISDKQPILAIVSDLKRDGDYGSSVVVFYDDCVVSVDEKDENTVHLNYTEISELYVKRMYGSAIVFARVGEDCITLLVSTLDVVGISDAAVYYINKIISKSDSESAREQLESIIKKSGCFCKRCGAELPTANSKCPSCNHKSGNRMFVLMYTYIKKHVPSLVVSFIISLFTTAASLVPPYIISKMVDDIIPNNKLNLLIYVIALLISAYFVQIGVGALRNYLLRIVGINMISDMKNDIYAKAQYLPMSFYDKTSTGAVINRINSDTATFKQFLITISQDAVVNLFTMIGIIIVMLVMNWKLTLVALIPVPAVVLISRKLNIKMKPKYRRLWKRNVAVSSIISNTIPAIRIVKSFVAQERTIDEFEKKVDGLKTEDISIGKIAVTLPAFITFLIMCGTALIWFVGGNMVIRTPDALSLGVLVSFISYASMFYGPVNFFSTLTDTYQNATASAERLMDIIEAESEPDTAKGKHPEKIVGKIEFRNVNFSFDKSKKVLSNINFVINPGDVVGIVGTTGSGKTTLINLLMRFYSDYDGDILVDDINIKDIDLSFYRNQIGYVQQEPMLFKDTIFNNIAYARPDAIPEEIMLSAEIASAHSFIRRMPDGYDTVVGEHGVGLSGGEKQRISIARAVLKEPSIMVLDEATSAMDSETEKLIQAAIDEIVGGRTTLMIAHRLSTLKKANKIIVVDRGKIIEFGTPEELMALKGKYYKLINMQSMREKAKEVREIERFD